MMLLMGSGCGDKWVGSCIIELEGGEQVYSSNMFLGKVIPLGFIV